jgi:hypothetical protein
LGRTFTNLGAFNECSNITIMLGFIMTKESHQTSCISSSQLRWMHFDKVLKWISTHQQWYKCLQEAIVLDHIGENPNSQYGQHSIIKHFLKPKSLTSIRCKAKASTLLIWKPKSCWNFAKSSLATSQDFLQKMTFYFNENNLLFINSISLWTLSNFTCPCFARVWKALTRHLKLMHS